MWLQSQLQYDWHTCHRGSQQMLFSGTLPSKIPKFPLHRHGNLTTHHSHTPGRHPMTCRCKEKKVQCNKIKNIVVVFSGGVFVCACVSLANGVNVLWVISHGAHTVTQRDQTISKAPVYSTTWRCYCCTQHRGTET